MSSCIWRRFVESGNQGKEKGKEQRKRNSVGPSREKTFPSGTESRRKCIYCPSTYWRSVSFLSWRLFGGTQSSPCWSLIQLNCDLFHEHILILQNYLPWFCNLRFTLFPKKWAHDYCWTTCLGGDRMLGAWRGNSLNEHFHYSLLASPLNQPYTLSSLWLFSHCLTTKLTNFMHLSIYSFENICKINLWDTRLCLVWKYWIPAVYKLPELW